MEKVEKALAKMNEEVAREMDSLITEDNRGNYTRVTIGTDTAKEASYDSYARMKIVKDATMTNPDDWYVVGPKIEGGSITTIGTGKIPSGFTIAKANPDTKDLQDVKDMAQLLSEAGQSSLHDLCNLWHARWGTNWVKRGEIDGEFWEVAAARLHAAARLEAHVLADGTRVFKLDNE